MSEGAGHRKCERTYVHVFTAAGEVELELLETRPLGIVLEALERADEQSLITDGPTLDSVELRMSPELGQRANLTSGHLWVLAEYSAIGFTSVISAFGNRKDPRSWSK